MDDEPRLRDVQGNEPWMEEGEGRGDLRWLVGAFVLGALIWGGAIWGFLAW